jgi:hypothetical protein
MTQPQAGLPAPVRLRQAPPGGRPSDCPLGTFVSNLSENERVHRVITEHMLDTRFSLGRRVMPLPEKEERQLREIEQEARTRGLQVAEEPVPGRDQRPR